MLKFKKKHQLSVAFLLLAEVENDMKRGVFVTSKTELDVHEQPNLKADGVALKR